jgi:hypothetical protein
MKLTVLTDNNTIIAATGIATVNALTVEIKLITECDLGEIR